MINYLRFKFIRHFTAVLLIFSVGNSCKDNPTTGDKNAVISTHIGSILGETDAELLVEVAEISLAEIKLGQLAQRNAQVTDIRELGKRMEKAHGAYLETLRELSKKRLIMLPLSTTQKAQKLLEKLEKTPKNAFDEAYCNQTVAAHEVAIRTFESLAKNNKNADIQQWASTTLADLQLQRAYVLMHKRTFDKNLDKKKRSTTNKKRSIAQT